MSFNDIQVGGSHYQNKDHEQHWDFTWRNSYNQFEYCISKYVARCFKKNGLEDLKKAAHHLDKYISLVGKHKPVPGGRTTSDIETFSLNNFLDPYQSSVLYYVHAGFLDEAKDALNGYISKLSQEELQAPREYVTGGD